MAWTDGDFKIFAAGLAVGGKWNHTHGTLPRVESSVPSGTYWHTLECTLSCPVKAATILYSADGETPSAVYQGEKIYIADTRDLYAFAIYKQGISPMSRFRYIIDNPMAQTELVELAIPAVRDVDEIVLGGLILEQAETVSLEVPDVADDETIVI